MAQPAGGSAGKLALARLAVALAVAGLLAQAGFMVREMDEELAAPSVDRLRSLMVEADRVIPDGAAYATTSAVRADNARYFLYPRQRVAVDGFDQATLDQAGVRYVVVTNDVHPPELAGEQPWFRVLVRTPAGRVLDVDR